MTKHVPVLLRETVDSLNLRNGMTVVDATTGGGGHATAILERILPDGRFVGFDADGSALERFHERLTRDTRLASSERNGRIVLVHRNFSELSEALEEAGIGRVDGIVADLGFSSDQIEDARRGLSFLRPGPLDMRLDPRESLTAEHIVETYSEDALAELLSGYGDERFARRIARAIVRARSEASAWTTGRLSAIVSGAVPAVGKGGRIHPATRTFQALRMAVNREPERLEAFLSQAVSVLRPGGRLAVITFHSGEDRIVKRFFREHSSGCACPPEFPVCRCGRVPLLRTIFRKPAVPDAKETEANPRARSARLRVAERL